MKQKIDDEWGLPAANSSGKNPLQRQKSTARGAPSRGTQAASAVANNALQRSQKNASFKGAKSVADEWGGSGRQGSPSPRR